VALTKVFFDPDFLAFWSVFFSTADKFVTNGYPTEQPSLIH